MASEAQELAFERLKGVTVKKVVHHEIISLVEIHFDSGACLHIQATNEGDNRIVILEPKEGSTWLK